MKPLLAVVGLLLVLRGPSSRPVHADTIAERGDHTAKHIQTVLHASHQTKHARTARGARTLVAPAGKMVIAPDRIVATVAHRVASPHAAPSIERPAAPS